MHKTEVNCNARHKDPKNKYILPQNSQNISLLVVDILQLIHTVTQVYLFFDCCFSMCL